MTVMRFEPARRPLIKLRRGRAKPAAVSAVSQAIAQMRKWRRRARERAELAALGDRMLADIGLTRAEAEFLVNKPFWRE